MNNTKLESGIDATSELTHYNKRGNPYRVLVTVLEYSPCEAMTHDHPGYPSQIDSYDARTSLGAVIELTDDELLTVLEEYEDQMTEQAVDYRI